MLIRNSHVLWSRCCCCLHVFRWRFDSLEILPHEMCIGTRFAFFFAVFASFIYSRTNRSHSHLHANPNMPLESWQPLSSPPVHPSRFFSVPIRIYVRCDATTIDDKSRMDERSSTNRYNIYVREHDANPSHIPWHTYRLASNCSRFFYGFFLSCKQTSIHRIHFHMAHLHQTSGVSCAHRIESMRCDALHLNAMRYYSHSTCNDIIRQNKCRE